MVPRVLTVQLVWQLSLYLPFWPKHQIIPSGTQKTVVYVTLVVVLATLDGIIYGSFLAT